MLNGQLALLFGAGLGGLFVILISAVLWDIRRLRTALHDVNTSLTSIIARLAVIEYALGLPNPPDPVRSAHPGGF